MPKLEYIISCFTWLIFLRLLKQNGQEYIQCYYLLMLEFCYFIYYRYAPRKAVWILLLFPDPFFFCLPVSVYSMTNEFISFLFFPEYPFISLWLFVWAAYFHVLCGSLRVLLPPLFSWCDCCFSIISKCCHLEHDPWHNFDLWYTDSVVFDSFSIWVFIFPEPLFLMYTLCST